MSVGGLSRTRLGTLHDSVKSYIDGGEVVGAITAIERRGELHVDMFGLQDRERNVPLRRDTIFRIASMTKPVTAAAAMILVEEAKLRLDEPVDRLMPELANRKVLRSADGPIDDTVAARRPITPRDLLTFCGGMGISFAPTPTPMQKAMDARQLFGLKPPTPHNPDQWAKLMGELPLMYQPGERWLYHTGSDILGVLIARAAGMPFPRFLKERLFDPLGMKDTGFHVPADKTDRLASCYSVNPKTRELELFDDGKASQWSSPPPFPMGGGGLVSTVDDYLAFGRMMLGYGKAGKERIISRPSVEAMTTDQLTADQKGLSNFMPGYWDHQGWGFGVSVVKDRTSVDTTPGRFGWNGAFGTMWTSDPKEQMISILMIQHMGMAPGPGGIGGDFWPLAYQAIDD